MVTVAKNINAPIKLIFPRPAEMEKPSMLGLGDIVLPGIYIALLLRYDIWKYLESLKTNNDNNSNNNMKVIDANVSYRTWEVCLVCYVIALGNCLFIMYYFEHAQVKCCFQLILLLYSFIFKRGLLLFFQYYVYQIACITIFGTSLYITNNGNGIFSW